MTADKDNRDALERFVVENENLERLESLLAKFNIFEAIGVFRQEIRHSNFLAFLLDPSQTHRLNDVFLKRLLKRVLIGADAPALSPVEIDIAHLSDAEVRREWKNIDVLVRSPSNRMVFVIENKVDSGEHSNQLSRYRQIVLAKFPDYRSVFIYLTVTGEAPLREEDQKNWIAYTYTQIAELVSNTSESYKSTLGSDVYMLMSHYSNLLRRHIVGDSEIAELCRKIYSQHKQALDLIYEHRPDLQSEIADDLKKLVQNSRSSGIELDNSPKNRIRFAITRWDQLAFQRTCVNWTRSRRILLFELANEPQELSLILTVGPGNASIKQAAYRAISSQGLNGLAEERTMGDKGWNFLYKRQIFDPSDYEDISFEALSDRVRAFWHKFLNGDLKIIDREIFEQMVGFDPEHRQQNGDDRISSQL